MNPRRLIGALVGTAGLAVAAFAVALGMFLESGHGGSVVQASSRRVAMELRDEPRAAEVAKHAFSEAALAFSWLDASLLVLLASALALVAAGVVISRRPR